MSYNFIYLTLSGASTPGQSGTGSDGNDGVLCVHRSSSITETLQGDPPKKQNP